MFTLICAFIPLLITQATPEDTARIAQLPPTQSDLSDDRIEMRAGGRMDVRLREVAIFDALELLSEESDRNIVIENGVTGTVSLVLRQVTFEESLNAILRSNNLVYEVRDGITFVFPRRDGAGPAGGADGDKKSAEADELETRVFTLNYVTAIQAEEFVKPLLDTSAMITRTAEPKEGIESDKESAGGFAPAGREILVVVASKKRLAVIERALAEFDQRPPQVLVEATILRATLNEQNALGIDFNTLGGIDLQMLNATSPGVTDLAVGALPFDRLDNFSSTLRTDFNDRVPGGGFTFGIVKDQLGFFIRALEQITDVTIMANPKMLTLNKQRGEVIVGRRDGYLTTTVTETAAVQSVEYLETGTKLIFRPFVTGQNEVRMEIHPEDSNGGLTAANLPFQETTEATTNILLKDGHTILIGGLFRERSNASKSQVPLVGNVPVLGNLFGVQQDQTVREEVIILLTVHVLRDDAASAEAYAAVSEDAERMRVNARNGLMGSGRDQLAGARYRDAVEQLQAGQIDKALSNLDAALQLNPRHLDAVKLREKLVRERTWHATGSAMRTFLAEMLNEQQGKTPRPVQGLPNTDAMVENARAAEIELEEEIRAEMRATPQPSVTPQSSAPPSAPRAPVTRPMETMTPVPSSGGKGAAPSSKMEPKP
ncbi:MAG: hypothetical protein SF069_14300 [Phycisphaerae bacterium]|nr:hypothetical protein [Phycisphaerae bacterium]